jgi:hypothetical protein
MVKFTSIHVGVILNTGKYYVLYGSPPGEEQEVMGGEEGVVIEPIVGVEEETVLEQMRMFSKYCL